jgi:hypothetical protein
LDGPSSVDMPCLVCGKVIVVMFDDFDKTWGGPSSVLCSPECIKKASENPEMLFVRPQ